jgi:hypothetical protein
MLKLMFHAIESVVVRTSDACLVPEAEKRMRRNRMVTLMVMRHLRQE